VLTASAQHFFGSGRTREGKRVRPVIVLLMGNVCSLMRCLLARKAYP